MNDYITYNELEEILNEEYAEVEVEEYEELDGMIFERYDEKEYFITDRLTVDNKLVRFMSMPLYQERLLQAQDIF